MRFELKTAALLVALSALLSSCGDDSLEFDTSWAMGSWSTFGVDVATTNLARIELREDGVARFEELSCAAEPVTVGIELSWRADGPDAIVIVDESDGTIYGVDHLRLVRDVSNCDSARVEMIEDAEVQAELAVFRGQLCLMPASNCTGSCDACWTQWCDAAPASCG